MLKEKMERLNNNKESSSDIEKNILKSAEHLLLIIDMQEKLMNVIPNKEKIISNTIKLIDAANTLNTPIFHTEQNPIKLGGTIQKIRELLSLNSFSKMSFSCMGCKDLTKKLKKYQIKNIIICGIEAHVCVLQTALDLIEQKYSVHIILDAISSRNSLDRDTAFQRLQAKGAILSTTETIIFEICKTSEREEFRQVSKIIKRT
tara:strand:- start:163 stop:771 length:609 start_codon:yes stop_codon:yes gene_type:complete